jgi:hypothetical protein
LARRPPVIIRPRRSAARRGRRACRPPPVPTRCKPEAHAAARAGAGRCVLPRQRHRKPALGNGKRLAAAGGGPVAVCTACCSSSPHRAGNRPHTSRPRSRRSRIAFVTGHGRRRGALPYWKSITRRPMRLLDL